MCGDGARLEDDEERYTSVMSQRPDTCNEDSYLRSGRPSSLFRTSFSNAQLEEFYRASSLQQRRGGLQYFLMSMIFYGIYTVSSPDLELPSRSVAAVSLGLNLCLLVWAKYSTKKNDTLSAIKWTSTLVWQLCIGVLLLQVYVKTTDVTLRDELGWLLLFLYLLFATLPLFLPCCVIYAFCAVFTYTSCIHLSTKEPISYDILVGNVT